MGKIGLRFYAELLLLYISCILETSCQEKISLG